jgi:hypothetical protein
LILQARGQAIEPHLAQLRHCRVHHHRVCLASFLICAELH